MTLAWLASTCKYA